MATRISSLYKTCALFVVVFLVLLAPAILRWHYFDIPGIVGFPTYMHQRTAQDMIEGTFNWYDSLSFGGRPYTYPPAFPIFLAGFGLALGLGWGGVIMMALLGAATAVLFYLVAREFIPGRKSAILLATTPLFIYLFTHLSTRSPPMTLGLLTLYLLIKKKHWSVASLPLGLSFLFSPETGLVFTLVAFIYAANSGQHKTFLKMLAIALLMASVWYIPFLAQHGLPEYNLLHQDYADKRYGMEQFSLDKYVWETGFKGLPLILYALAAIGFICSRDAGRKGRFLRIWFLFALFIPVLFWRLFLYLLFPTIILASLGLQAVCDRTPRFRQLIPLSIMIYLAIAGGLFSLEFAADYPKQEQSDAMLWIRENVPEDAVVLSDWMYGHWVAGIGLRRNFMDGFAEYAPDVNERTDGLVQFYSDCTIPGGYNISHIYVEDWLIENNRIDCIFEDFDMVYNKSYIYVFEVS